MEQQLFYTHLNTAKLQFGDFRNKVNALIKTNDKVNKELLFRKIVQSIIDLKATRPFFKVIGKKCEVDIFIIGYQSLQARLDSS